MPCPSQNYSGGQTGPTTWTNWSGRFRGSVNTFWEPDTLADLVNVVRRASAERHLLHVVGSGWAFENIAFSTDWMVSLGRLNRPLSGVTDGALNAQWAASQAAGQDVLFHVEAGAKVADVSDLLTARGLAMPTLGGANGQAIAGAITTGTHGGDVDVPPLADAVMAMHLVTEGGRELWIERASQPITDDSALGTALARSCPDTEIVRNDDLFSALLVGFGRFGIIYSYVLRVQPAFRLAEWTTKISTTSLTSALRSGIAGGTFLAPLLTMLPTPPTALNAINVGSPRGVEVAFDTNNLGMCFVKRRWLTTDATDLGMSNSKNPLCVIGAAGVLTAATTVLGPFGAIPLYGAAVATAMGVLSASLIQNPLQPAGEMLARALSTFWALGLGGAIPQISGAEFGLQYQNSTGSGIRGPSNLIISGYREQSLQNCFRVDSIEPIFDAHSTSYIDFLDAILAAAPNWKQAGYIALRWSAMSRATLSMHNVPSAHAVAIEVTSLLGLPDNPTWMALIEAAAVARGGRPHWGQINSLNAASTVTMFGGKVVAWRSVLGSVVGGATTFSNAFTAQRGLEPIAGATATVSGKRSGDIAGGAVLQLLAVTNNGKVWHATRSKAGSWTPFGDVKSVTASTGIFVDVDAVGVAAELQVAGVTADGKMWHTIRRADGTWTPFGDVKAVVGDPGTFKTASAAQVTGELHLVGVTSDGKIWHTIRHTDGTWTPFGDVKAAVGDPGTFKTASTAQVAGDLHLVGVTANGKVWHTIRHTDGTWTPFGDVKAAVGDPGTFKTASTAQVAGELHLVGVTADGKMWHTIRHVNGTWTAFGDIRTVVGDVGTLVDADAASVAAELQVAGVTADGKMWHTIRHADGRWTPFGDVKAVVGDPGTFIAAATAASA